MHLGRPRHRGHGRRRALPRDSPVKAVVGIGDSLPQSLQRFFLRLTEVPEIMAVFTHMTFVKRSNTRAQLTCWLAMLAAMAFLPTAESDDHRSAGTTGEKHSAPTIRIVDQHGHQVPSGRRLGGGQIFDVAVGPVNKEFQFVPDTVNITIGDTVRWTWGSGFHSVTSGDSTSCVVDGQFCSPDNMNCDAGILN